MTTLTPTQIQAIADRLEREGWTTVLHSTRDVAMKLGNRWVDADVKDGVVIYTQESGNYRDISLSDPIWRQALAIIADVVDGGEATSDD